MGGGDSRDEFGLKDRPRGRRTLKDVRFVVFGGAVAALTKDEHFEVCDLSDGIWVDYQRRRLEIEELREEHQCGDCEVCDPLELAAEDAWRSGVEEVRLALIGKSVEATWLRFDVDDPDFTDEPRGFAPRSDVKRARDWPRDWPEEDGL